MVWQQVPEMQSQHPPQLHKSKVQLTLGLLKSECGLGIGKSHLTLFSPMVKTLVVVDRNYKKLIAFGIFSLEIEFPLGQCFFCILQKCILDLDLVFLGAKTMLPIRNSTK